MLGMQPFHLAFPIDDLESTRRFYVDILGCAVGREASTWIDFELFGHQISAHVRPRRSATGKAFENPVDGDEVPIPHFGVVLEWHEWHTLRDRLVAANTSFVVGPRIRFEGQVGEQATMFFRDPSGNHLEFKSFRDPRSLFAR
ncbi:MAG: VOC family protein [Planctomycetes bacterium]|nr:VOC family protein [Planctomycetota bacterium]MCB9920427.1 VOC family protein [Planctomycetota bacterium]